MEQHSTAEVYVDDSETKQPTETTERKNFLVREREAYNCGHCGAEVEGGRYNNHCPNCLWSKHMDKEIPGDRASECQELMEPIGVVQKKGKWRIRHKCTGPNCDHRMMVDSSDDDNFEVIIELSTNPS